jgi:aminopeptidase N
MKGVPLAVATAAAVFLLAMAGCSKKESPETPMPPPSVTTLPATQPLPALPPPAATSVAPAAAATDTNQASGDDQSQAELAAQVKQLETDYENTPDFQKRVTIIYELSSNDDAPDVINALAHLFLNEKDQELKIELVNSLTDVDGQNDKKLAVLSTALRADQPKEVRLEAIDGMGDAQDKRGIQILQGFLNDPDEDVKESAQDTIEQLQNVPEPSPQSQSTGQPGQ